MSDSGSESSDDSDMGVQVRISLTLSAECQNKSLLVPSEPIAVPADIGRKGLSAVINHLLDRRLKVRHEDEESDDGSDHDEADDKRLPAIVFDFMVGKNNKLLRTVLEREARRSGLSLEEAIPVTYFPAQRAPDLTGESEKLPDWVAALAFSPSCSLLSAGCYDGSLHLFRTKNRKGNPAFERVTVNVNTSQGPIKCLATSDEKDGALWIASGSMNHSLSLHRVDLDTYNVKTTARCTGGHSSAIGSVDFFSSNHTLASGDWDGGVCLWKVDCEALDPAEEDQPSKKSKTGSSKASSSSETIVSNLSPILSLQAHSSQVSGLSWGNYEKKDPNLALPEQLISGSWDHSLKVWNMERQDCLLTLNGSRAISCLDTSYFSKGVVVTGHPDCTVRLWDVRIGSTNESTLSLSDNTFRPSHKAWISAVQWSRHNPYHLSSASHDGVIKLWDIRSSLPLHSVRAFPKTDKGFAMSYGDMENGRIYAGGTDCIVKQFRCGSDSAQ
jgi:ribosome biogenesis protein